MKKLLNIVIFGPHGSGKGTQAKMLSLKYGIPVLTVGDILRKEVKNQTDVGKSAAFYLKRGELVPDKLVNKIIIERLKRSVYKKGFILDGYPRNMVQLEILEKTVDVSYVIELVVSDIMVISRLGGRLICPKCGEVYHVQNKPPKKEGICDICGAELVVRDDDKPEIIKKRLEIYHRQTEPLLNYYFWKKKLIRVNGEQPIEKVFEDIVSELGKQK